MRRVRLWTLTLFALLLTAPPAFAAEEFTDCSLDPMNAGAVDITQSSGQGPVISGGVLGIGRRATACWDFDEGEATNAQSPQVTIQAENVLICFDPADDDEDADTAVLGVRRLFVNTKPGTAAASLQQSIQVCGDLAGVGGDDDTQTACCRVGQGEYFFRVKTAGAAGDDSRVRMDIERN